MKAKCFFADLPGAGPCDGELVRCHLITRQVLRREVWAERTREQLRRRVEARGRSFPARLQELLRDPRAWVWGCGGLTGIGGHHGRFDHSRTLVVPRDRLPAEVEQFAADLGLLWWLDRTYGALPMASR